MKYLQKLLRAQLERIDPSQIHFLLIKNNQI